MNQVQAYNALDAGALVTLCELDGTGRGLGVWRWANTAESNGEAVRWRGVEYPPFDFKMEGFAWGGDAIPRPKITATMADPSDPLPAAFLDLVALTDGGQGLKLTTWRLLGRFLDGHEDGGSDFAPRGEVYYVDRCNLSREACTLELIAPLDAPHRTLPARFALHDTCPFAYRRFDKTTGKFVYPKATFVCPYTGKACFDRWGKPCKPEQDECGHRLQDCVKRHPAGAVPFGGYPGLGEVR